MRNSKILKFSMALALFAGCSAIMATAQQYEILRADYGYGNHRVDVTQKLRDIARNNATFRMGNSTFGIDPAPGHVKSLRIFAQDSQGNKRRFEYREGSTVDGSQFSGWDSGNWGGSNGSYGDASSSSGGYAILHAEYGTERNHVDVTNQLRDLARSNATFRMGNSTFGVDPDPGQIKTLRIYTRASDGSKHMFEFRESSTVDGSQFAGWGQGGWGNDAWNGNWGGSDGGNNTGNSSNSGGYAILHADYGTPRNHVDVTSQLQELARNNATFRMGNSTFGVDPDPGQIKTLRIYTRAPDGSNRMFEYREGSTVDGSQFQSWSQGNWGR